MKMLNNIIEMVETDQHRKVKIPNKMIEIVKTYQTEEGENAK